MEQHLSLGLAFLAGLASFFSPCVLALVPAYLGYLSSRTINSQGQVETNRWATVAHGAAFVVGFSAVFVTLGATASVLGALLYDARYELVRIGSFHFGLVHIGGLVVIILGLHTLGLVHIPYLDYDLRHHTAPDRRLGWAASALMGVFFSAGWTPCTGPVLAAVLNLAAESANIHRGILLLLAYSFGLGIPFMLTAAGFGNISAALRRYGKHLRYVSIATGIFLMLIGVLLLTDSLAVFTRLTSFTRFQNLLELEVVNFWNWLTGNRR